MLYSVDVHDDKSEWLLMKSISSKMEVIRGVMRKKEKKKKETRGRG